MCVTCDYSVFTDTVAAAGFHRRSGFSAALLQINAANGRLVVENVNECK